MGAPKSRPRARAARIGEPRGGGRVPREGDLRRGFPGCPASRNPGSRTAFSPWCDPDRIRRCPLQDREAWPAQISRVPRVRD